MAASSSRRGKAGGGSAAFLVKTPISFFKIVVGEALRDGKIEIPEVVVLKRGNYLADLVFLKVPTGAIWQVELTRSGDMAWLQKGWPEFANFYSLKHGYFLIFDHEGYSRFQVRIFHRNSLEIDYPFNASHAEEPNLSERFQLPEMEELGDEDVIILDSPPPKTREEIALESFWTHKMMQPNSGDKAKGHSNLSGETKAFLRAKSFKSENPFLVVKVHKSYLSQALRLSAPFVRKHVCANGVRYINLQSSDGRTWAAKCIVVEYSKKTYVKVYGGWRAFVQENRLNEGDACVFELVEKGQKVTFKVGIYSAKDAV